VSHDKAPDAPQEAAGARVTALQPVPGARHVPAPADAAHGRTAVRDDPGWHHHPGAACRVVSRLWQWAVTALAIAAVIGGAALISH
jgi:hypothetical protein